MGLALKVYGGFKTIRFARFILSLLGIKSRIILIYPNELPATQVVFTVLEEL
jgi:hypothetical protein